jgi:hypothetical protein
MLVIVPVSTYRATGAHAIDTRRIVLEYCQRWSVFRYERSRLIDAREQCGVNALGEWLRKELCILVSATPRSTDDSASADLIGILA